MLLEIPELRDMFMLRFVTGLDSDNFLCDTSILEVQGMDERILDDLVKSTKALLLLQLHSRTRPEDPEKPELILNRAGFNAREIAALLGKNEAAVRKSIQRAGKAA